MDDEQKKPLELKDLLDSKLPILERFREMAPGTFKHSQNVSLLCESVGLELDLDIDLMKVAGMYHDLGKLNSPELFSENQNGKNPHENLDPMVSYHLITRHVGDTILLMLNNFDDFTQKQKLMEIMSQHHGNTVLQFFYKKSKSKVEDPFRYKSVPPQSIEAAVLMICDSVEATARSLDAADDLKDSKDRRSVINTTVDRLMQDYQLDDIKVGMLRKVKTVLYKELDNIYHKREVYGDEKAETEDDDTIKV